VRDEESSYERCRLTKHGGPTRVNPPKKSLVPRDYRYICGGGLGAKNGELRAVKTLFFKQPYWGRRGYTAV